MRIGTRFWRNELMFRLECYTVVEGTVNEMISTLVLLFRVWYYYIDRGNLVFVCVVLENKRKVKKFRFVFSILNTNRKETCYDKCRESSRRVKKIVFGMVALIFPYLFLTNC